eukprot:scaffold181349_cov26-Prasinocladus_malaysianus.AAC.1
MRGPRETVAKALALECMRGAHRQQRKCYLYAFSGPEEVPTWPTLPILLPIRSLDKTCYNADATYYGTISPYEEFVSDSFGWICESITWANVGTTQPSIPENETAGSFTITSNHVVLSTKPAIFVKRGCH